MADRFNETAVEEMQKLFIENRKSEGSHQTEDSIVNAIQLVEYI